MKYVAFLRGINVGGNAIIKMADLKIAFEKIGLKNVTTYINSGNVIFESDENNIEVLTATLEIAISKSFNNIRLVIRSYEQLQKVASNIPSFWKKQNDLRCYVAFVKTPLTPKEVMEEIDPKKDVDFVKEGANEVYLSTKLSGLTKSGFTKLISKPIYKYLTMRNYNTVQKILELMK